MLFLLGLLYAPGVRPVFATHPMLEQRFDQLGHISAELGEAPPPGKVC